MAKKKRTTKAKTLTSSDRDYGDLLDSTVDLLEAARRLSARVINSVMTATYWESVDGWWSWRSAVQDGQATASCW